MKIFENFDLSLFNSYQIRAICSKIYFPENELDFIEIYSKYNNGKKKIIIGAGNNIIFSKDYYEEEFICIGKGFSQIKLEGENTVIADAGVHTKELCDFALLNELSGVEVFYDIPSSVGGAVVMNAGASGEEIKDILIRVKYLDLKDLAIKEICKNEINFEYRNSFFQKNNDKIVLEAVLQLNRGKYIEIYNKMEEIKAARWLKQPRKFPNAGSVFKRPKGYYVGALIDELNLKGFSIGGAKISEKHGGFIVNFNNAKGIDMINIINEVKQRVFDKYKIDLEVEQRII